jgi:hypothetical protein
MDTFQLFDMSYNLLTGIQIIIIKFNFSTAIHTITIRSVFTLLYLDLFLPLIPVTFPESQLPPYIRPKVFCFTPYSSSWFWQGGLLVYARVVLGITLLRCAALRWEEALCERFFQDRVSCNS